MEEFNLEGLNTELERAQNQLNERRTEYQRAAESLREGRDIGDDRIEATARSEMSRLVSEISEIENRITELQNAIQEGPELQNQLNERRAEYQRATESLREGRDMGDDRIEATARSEMSRLVSEMTELQNRINGLQSLVTGNEQTVPNPVNTEPENAGQSAPEQTTEQQNAELQNQLNEREAEYQRVNERFNEVRESGDEAAEATLRAEITRLVEEISVLRNRVSELENMQQANSQQNTQENETQPAPQPRTLENIETERMAEISRSINDERYENLTTLMNSIREADELSNGEIVDANGMKSRRQRIEAKREELRNETRPVVVEELRVELANLEVEKSEFDEMTRASLERAREEASEIRAQSEKAYNDKLVEILNRRNEIERKLKVMRERNASDPKRIEAAEIAAQKALDSLNREMEYYQSLHSEKMGKLDEYMKYIDEAINVRYADVKYEAPEQGDNGGKTPPTSPVPPTQGDNGQGKDGDNGQGKDGDNGQGKDGDNSQGKDGDNGQGKDGDNGQGKDGDDGQGKDGDDGQGKDGDDGQGKDGDNGQGKDGDNGQGKDGDNGQGKDGDNGQGKDGDDGQGKDGDNGQGKDGDNGQGKDGDDGQGKKKEPQEPEYKVGKIRGFFLKIVQAILKKVKRDGFMGKFFGGIESTLLVGAKEALPTGNSKPEPTKTPEQPAPEQPVPEQENDKILSGRDDSEWARDQMDQDSENSNTLIHDIIVKEMKKMRNEGYENMPEEELQEFINAQKIPEIEVKGKDGELRPATPYQNILYCRIAQRVLDNAQEKGIDIGEKNDPRKIDDIYADLERKHLQEKTNEASRKAAEQQRKGGTKGREGQGKDSQDGPEK